MLQAEFLRKIGTIVFWMDNVEQRMAMPFDGHALPLVEAFLEFEHDHHLVDQTLDLCYPSLAPGPDLRRDIIHDRHIQGAKLFRQAKIESGVVDQDRQSGPMSIGCLQDIPLDLPDKRQMLDNLPEPKKRELVDMVAEINTGHVHAVAADTDQLDIGPQQHKFGGQQSADIIPRGLPGDDKDGRAHFVLNG